MTEEQEKYLQTTQRVDDALEWLRSFEGFGLLRVNAKRTLKLM